MQSEYLPRNNPTDLLHGILCEHVKHESMRAPHEDPDFKVGGPVVFEYRPIQNDFLFGLFEMQPSRDEDFIYSVFQRQITKNPKIEY